MLLTYQGIAVNALFYNCAIKTLLLLRNTSKQKTDRIRKDITKIFNNSGFKIEIKTNLHIVDVLDVTFNLLDGTYKPYKKFNDQLLYVNTSSDHPP